MAYAQLSLHRKRHNISWMVVQRGGVSGALSGGAAAPRA